MFTQTQNISVLQLSPIMNLQRAKFEVLHPEVLQHTNKYHTSVINTFYLYMMANQKVKAIFKLHDNRDREELVHCAVLTVPVDEFSHVQYSALPSVEWQQRGQKYGCSFARSHHRRT